MGLVTPTTMIADANCKFFNKTEEIAKSIAKQFEVKSSANQSKPEFFVEETPYKATSEKQSKKWYSNILGGSK